MKIGIIGNGSWATALAKLLNTNNYAICWWMRDEDAVQHLKQRNHNPQYLTSVYFPSENVHPTSRLQEVFEQCEVILIAVPSAYIAEVLDQLPDNAFENKKIISAIKGVLPATS